MAKAGVAPLVKHASKISKGRAKAGNYAQPVNNMLIEACQEYEAIVVTTDPLPSSEMKELYGRQVWAAVCTRRKETYGLDDEMLKVVRRPLQALAHTDAIHHAHERILDYQPRLSRAWRPARRNA